MTINTQQSLKDIYDAMTCSKPYVHRIGEIIDFDVVYCIYSTNASNIEHVADLVMQEIDNKASSVGEYRFFSLCNDYLVVCFSSNFSYCDMFYNFNEAFPGVICELHNL